MFLFSLDKYSEVALLGHMAALFKFFRKLHTVFLSDCIENFIYPILNKIQYPQSSYPLLGVKEDKLESIKVRQDYLNGVCVATK